MSVESEAAARELLVITNSLPVEWREGPAGRCLGFLLGSLVADVGAELADQYLSTFCRVLHVASDADRAAMTEHLVDGMEHVMGPLR